MREFDSCSDAELLAWTRDDVEAFQNSWLFGITARQIGRAPEI